MLLIHDSGLAGGNDKKARLSSRALILWGLCLTASTVLACTDGNIISGWIAALLLPLSPTYQTTKERAILAFIGFSSLVFGPHILLIGAPLGLALSTLGQPALVSLGLLISSVLFYPKIQSLPINSGQPLQLASLIFLVAAAWVPLLIFYKSVCRKSVLILGASPVLIASFLFLGAEHWMTPEIFTNDLFRYFLAIMPSFLAARYCSLQPSELPKLAKIAAGAIVGFILTMSLPNQPIKKIIFDEAHGKWETTQAPFGPDNFGRSATYTYSELYKKSELLAGSNGTFLNEDQPLPSHDSLLVIKTPTKRLSQKFSKKVSEWIASGGRLIVVADHTDLYDTTQNLNEFLLQHLGVQVNTDAVYSSSGMPNTPTTKAAAVGIGRIDAHGRDMPWLTGASLKKIPFMSIELASFGLSFSEEGDYSRQNRFGQFSPAIKNRYFNHTAVLAIPHGLGAAVVVLDSTPWSNFSIFREQYSQIFRSIVWALERPQQIFLLSLISLILFVFAVTISVVNIRFYEYFFGLFFGIIISAGGYIGMSALSQHEEGRDFVVKIASGSQIRFEILKKLLIPGQQNYSRIISSLGKYNLMPLATSPGTEIPQLKDSKKWLLIAPDSKQLPKYNDTLNHLRAGSDLTILFSPEQSINSDVRVWLNQWGLFTKRSIGLSTFNGATSINGSLLDGRGLVMGREIRTLTVASRTSLLNSYLGDQFIQSYTLRPSKFPRQSGILSVGFSSEQFSDDAVGEVWEGTTPSSLGKLREHQLASIILNDQRPSLMPKDLFSSQKKSIDLSAFTLLENGQVRFSGTFDDASSADETTTYFINLRDQAAGFIAHNCPSLEKVTLCKKRLLGEDMIEWMVRWSSGGGVKVQTIELLHERKMSGLNSTWNVIFGN